jgi:hypothetical protein
LYYNGFLASTAPPFVLLALPCSREIVLPDRVPSVPHTTWSDEVEDWSHKRGSPLEGALKNTTFAL